MGSKVTEHHTGENSPQSLLAAIVESSNDAIIGKNLQGTILSWNRAAERLFGYSRVEAIGKPISLIIPDDRLDEMVSILDAVGRGEIIEHFRTQRRHRDGTIIDVSLTVSPIVDEQGTIVGASKIARDLTTANLARSQIAALNGHLAAIVESSDDIIVSKDLTGTIVSWNRAAERIFGYTAEEAIGQSISLIIPPERHGDMVKVLSAISRGERIEHFETQRITKDGRIIDVANTVSPILDDQGKVIGASKIGRDITEAKRAQRELERKVLEVQVLNEAGRLLGATLNVERIYENIHTLVSRLIACDGLLVSSFDPVQNLIETKFLWAYGQVLDPSLIPLTPPAPAGQGFQSEVLRTGKPMRVSDAGAEISRVVANLGKEDPNSVFAAPDAEKNIPRSLLLVPMKLDAEVIGIVVVYSLTPDVHSEDDLTLLEALVGQLSAAVRNAELYQRVKESEAELRLMANAMPQISWALDATGNVQFINAQYSEYIGFDVMNAPLEKRASIVHPDEMAEVIASYSRAIQLGEVWEDVVRLRRSDGQYRWHLSRLIPVKEGGQIVRWFGTSTDIHEKIEAEERARREGAALKESQRQLERLNAELEHRVQQRTAELQAANQEMEGFTHSVSHDLRAPLRSIMSSSMIILEDYGSDLPDEATSLLRRQAAAAKRLANIVEDLLQYSRLGRKEITSLPVSLSDIARSISADLSVRATDRKVEWRIQPHLEAQGDPNLIAMLLQNLFDNAFKFTTASEPAVIELGRDDDGFFVRDNGVGFDMAYASKLFTPFERLHREVDYAGTGIGLANVKRIVERHGGRVWAEAKPNEGATFHFTLAPESEPAD